MDPTKHQRPTNAVNQAVNGGWVEGGSFLGSILSGLLIGYLLDMWLGTGPWLVVAGIIAGSYAGFVSMWRISKRMDESR